MKRSPQLTETYAKDGIRSQTNYVRSQNNYTQKQFRIMVITIILASVLLFGIPFAKANESLPIPPVVQQTQLWCWAAVLEMALKYYGYGIVNPGGNYQCGIVAMLGGNCESDCRCCVTGIGSFNNLGAVLEAYGAVTLSLNIDGEPLSYHIRQRLSVKKIVAEIDEGDPIIAGISPSGLSGFYPPGFGEHLALIIGYESSDRHFKVIVNDPYPYFYVEHDPYLSAGAELLELGKYLIDFRAFQRNLGYKDSIYFGSQR